MSDLAALFADHRTRTQVVAAAYEAASPQDRRRVLLVEYRCRNGCLLLACWQSPMGRLVRLPSYRLSDRLNDATSPVARQKRTNGRGKWDPRHLILDELTEWDGAAFDLNCDHVTKYLATPAEVHADAADAMPGRPTRRVKP